MAELVALVIGLLLFGLGSWILLLRATGFYDLVHPHSMYIGQMTVDGVESKAYSELFRARFDHHFRRPAALPTETGFLEAAALDTPELFQPKGVEGVLQNMTLEVSGVNVTAIVKFVNQLAAPDQWVVEGDLQTHPDRALLALRLRRGARLIRTWYLERYTNASSERSEKSADKSALLEPLIDDAIFQLVYDFVNPAEQDRDLRKWRSVFKSPPDFPSPAAVAAYYEAQGALGRYYAHGDWRDLGIAVDRLRDLRSQMPRFGDGLRLLGMALAENRAENEAIHVYEQLELLLVPSEGGWDSLGYDEKRRVLYVRLLKATAKAKLLTWPSAHESISELSRLWETTNTEREKGPAMPVKERAAYDELLGQTAAQLAYTYALYLDYLSHSSVTEVFGNEHAPRELRISDPERLKTLARASKEAAEAKRIVRDEVRSIESQYKMWLERGWSEEGEKEGDLGTMKQKEQQWKMLDDGERRRAELKSRLLLASGYANYRMATWERGSDVRKIQTKEGETNDEPIFGQTFETRLANATRELHAADAAHPNHYLVLQLLGLVTSEPRLEEAGLSVAEQYFDRAIRAKPSDYEGHELLAAILFRRIASRGVDLASRDAMLRGLGEAQKAVSLVETSGQGHLLRAEFQTLILEIERDAAKRQELREGLAQSLDHAERFLPKPLGIEDPDLTWVRVINTTRRLGEPAETLPLTSQMTADTLALKKQQRFNESRAELTKLVGELIDNCKELEERWVAEQRVFQIERVRERAQRLREEIDKSTLDNWREIKIAFQ